MTDRYIKTVLTIIAICLVWIVARGTAPRVYALAEGGEPPLSRRQVERIVERCSMDAPRLLIVKNTSKIGALFDFLDCAGYRWKTKWRRDWESN